MIWILLGVVVVVGLGFGSLVAKEMLNEKRIIENGRPVAAALLMVNRDMHDRNGASSNPGAVLFGRDKPSRERLEQLKEICERFYALYNMEVDELEGLSEAEQFIGFTLQEEAYEDGRRIRVPAELVDGEELWIADIFLFRDRMTRDWKDVRAVACAVTGRDKGEIVQLPLGSTQANSIYRKLGLPKPIFAPRA